METNLQIEELHVLVNRLEKELELVKKQVEENKNYNMGQGDFQIRRPLDNITANILDDKTKDIRNYKRVRYIDSVATLNISAETDDAWYISAQSSAVTINAPTGNPTNLQPLIIRIKDNGTARAITWDSIFVGSSLPTTTTIGKTLYVGFFYNEEDAKWHLVAYQDGF